MEYLLTFTEGLISFISPCLLPMLPVYIAYLTGGKQQKSGVKNALGFVLGFTIVFMCMGLLAGLVGKLFAQYRVYVNVVCGLIVVFFGLVYMNIIKIDLPTSKASEVTGFLSAVVFGLAFSVSLMPCVGAFLGSALALAGTQGGVVKGGALLLCYSAGLGVPYVLAAVFIGQLKGVVDFLKRHMRVISIISGIFLILTGVLMALGLLDRLLRMLL